PRRPAAYGASGRRQRPSTTGAAPIGPPGSVLGRPARVRDPKQRLSHRVGGFRAPLRARRDDGSEGGVAQRTGSGTRPAANPWSGPPRETVATRAEPEAGRALPASSRRRNGAPP